MKKKIQMLLLSMSIALFLAGCDSESSIQAEKNLAVVQRFVGEFWNQRNYDLLDELITSDFLHHETDGITRDKETYKKMLSGYDSFPDGQFTIHDIFAEDNKVAIHSTWQGTHQGEFRGLSRTGIKVSGLHCLTIFHLRDGKIAEIWSGWDQLGFMKQLGFTLQQPVSVKDNNTDKTL